ncbi:MAG: SIS domain-containing protein [Patescibacteria group bacterium]|nr:SIS domain-containing protein [Patescibacteria group bacterium]
MTKILDELRKIIKLHGGEEIINSVNSLPYQLKQSFEESLALNLSKIYPAKKIKTIVIGGMGGSRFPGVIIKELFKEKLTKPIIINDDYHLTEFVNDNTLIILSSYSGTTEEVLAMATQAKEKKAMITGLTIGGKLGQFLRENHFPYYLINPRYNPSGQPRIGFGYFVGGILGLLVSLGIVKEEKKTILKSFDELEKKIEDYKIEKVTKVNKIKKLAEEIFQLLPIYVVAEHLTGVGNAIANQTNETAKSMAEFRVIPELNHHLMEGLKFPKKIKQSLVFVFFFSSLYSSQVQKRFIITQEVVKKNRVKTLWVTLESKTKLDQVLELMAIGSFLSLYLSILYHQDPKIIPYVDYFKKKLDEMKELPKIPS